MNDTPAIPVNNNQHLASRLADHKYYVLGMLTAVYAVNIIDRNILIILLEPIKSEMGLSDTQLGFLTGISFAIFYSIVGVPLAILADRGNRRNIIAATLALFSGMTFLCGLAVNYVQLLLSRIFVAIGEAGTTPSAHSIISDLFPAHKRGSAIGIYSLGTNFGAIIGFLVGGWISQLYGWRMAFIVVGLPGLFLALLVYFTLSEPQRGQSEKMAAAADAEKPPRFKSVLKLMWSQRSLRHILAGVSVSAIGSYALIIWFPSFLLRSFDMNPGQVGTAMALIMGTVGAIGTYFSGHFGDRLGKRDIRWYVWIVAIFCGLNFPFLIAMYLSDVKWLVLCLFIYPSIAFNAYLAPSISIMHSLVGVRMRAQSSAIYFLIVTLVGQSIGPQLTGFLSDLYEPAQGRESLRYALMTVSGFSLWASVHFILAARTLKADIARVERLATAA